MNILVYSPGLAGHLQVYCRVITRALLDDGHRVTIAAPASISDWKSLWPVLRPLADEEYIRCVDIRPITGSMEGDLSAEQMIQVQKHCSSDVTLFTHADSFESQFRRIAFGKTPRLRGRVVAIFARTSEWCPGENAYTGEREPVVGPTLRLSLSRLKKAVFERRNSRRYFFEQVLLKRHTVDALVVKDERIPEHYGPPVFWMPEIFRVFDIQPEERRGADWERFAEPISHAFERAGGGNVLLYFGTGAWYKGYDLFLRLARSDLTVFALHAGAPGRVESGKCHVCDIESTRQELLRQGRLLETRTFVESDDLIRLLFSSVERYISTHRLTLSSGTALQALEMGKPILTPDTGLLGWRTRHYGLGMSYRYQDSDDLLQQFNEFRRRPLSPYVSSIKSAADRFGRQAVERFFQRIILSGYS